MLTTYVTSLHTRNGGTSSGWSRAYINHPPLFVGQKMFSHLIIINSLLSSFFTKLFVLYGPLLGGWGAFWFYMFYRTLESNWFVWVTQMNHIPMQVESDQQLDWASQQCSSTCNVTGGWYGILLRSTAKHPLTILVLTIHSPYNSLVMACRFNDWFTGHLNYQVEHHLFPTMPRHNYARVSERIAHLYKTHNVPFVVKPLLVAFADIVHALRRYGSIWKQASSCEQHQHQH